MPNDPDIFLFRAMMHQAQPGGQASDMITQDQKREQAKLVRSHKVPTKGLDRKILEGWGCVIGKQDKLFTHVVFPEGWKKVRAEHPMYSDIVDDQGRKRIQIFYKAAIYDTRADSHTQPCYRIYSDRYGRKDRTGPIKVSVRDPHNRELFSTDFSSSSLEGPEAYDENSQRESVARMKCREWLDENIPNWNDPILSWQNE